MYLKIRSLKIQPVFEAKNLSQNDSSSPCFLGIKNLGNFWMKVYEESPTKQLKFQSAEVAEKSLPCNWAFPNGEDKTWTHPAMRERKIVYRHGFVWLKKWLDIPKKVDLPAITSPLA